MPLYHTVCEGCGRQEEDFLATVSEVIAFGDHKHGFACETCGAHAVITTDVARNIKLPGDNRLPADVSGERLTPAEFSAKYGKDYVPVEPGSAIANRKRDALKAHTEARAKAAGYRDTGHMLKEVKRRTASTSPGAGGGR